MEMDLPNTKAVLANEALPKGSPRPGSFNTLNEPRYRQVGLPVCIVLTFSSFGEFKK
jgi:hypothetical protein